MLTSVNSGTIYLPHTGHQGRDPVEKSLSYTAIPEQLEPGIKSEKQ